MIKLTICILSIPIYFIFQWKRTTEPSKESHTRINNEINPSSLSVRAGLREMEAGEGGGVGVGVGMGRVLAPAQ